MLKKVLTFIALFSILFFFLSYSSFANEKMMEDMKKVENKIDSNANSMMNNAKDKIENAGKDISNYSKEATNSIENAGENMKNDIKNNMDMNKSSDYNATRTSTEIDNPSFLGLSSSSITSLIVGITAILIIALIWNYATQKSKEDDYDNN